jgi:hypothetical protein
MTPSTDTSSGIMVPSTGTVSFITRHMTSVLGAMTTTRGRQHHRSLRTFHYGGLRRHSLCARHHGLTMGKGSGFLDSRRRIFLRSRRAGFFSFPGQIGRFPAQYRFGGQPSKITKVQVLLENGIHLQVGPDNSHGRSAKYAGDIDEPGFCGCLIFSLGCYWFSGSSSRARLWPAFFCRHLRPAVLVICCAICGTGSSTVGARLRLLSVGSPTVSKSSSSS